MKSFVHIQTYVTKQSLDWKNQRNQRLIAEICEREAISKGPNKCIVIFKYFYEILTLLSAAYGGQFIAFFATVIGILVRIASSIFCFTFSITTGTIKKLLTTARNKNKKHSKIALLVLKQRYIKR